MTRSCWLSSDPDQNKNFRRRWAEPAWVLRLDQRAAREGPSQKRKLGAVAAAHRPEFSKSINASDSNRNEQIFQARQAAEALFIKAI